MGRTCLVIFLDMYSLPEIHLFRHCIQQTSNMLNISFSTPPVYAFRYFLSEMLDATIDSTTAPTTRAGASSHTVFWLIRGIHCTLFDSQSVMNSFTMALNVPQASSEPISDANTPSNTNGRRMVQFEAPTSRMISVSFLREAALMRIVVPVSMMATRIITPASATVTAVARFSTEKTGSKILR